MKNKYLKYILIILVIIVLILIGFESGLLNKPQFINDLNFVSKNEVIKKEETAKSVLKGVEYTKQESSLKTAINKVYDSVVEINTSSNIYNRNVALGAGSGVIISEDGYIVTNHHVLRNADKVSVKIADQSYDATIVGADEKTDLGLLKIEANNLTYAKIADSSLVDLGDDVFAIGNPLGAGISVSSGIISAKPRPVTIQKETQDLIQTNDAVNKGNSGGGLFNIAGELIGIINSKFSGIGIEGIAFAIPSNTVMKITEDLKTHGEVKDRSSLGIAINETANGIQITKVYPNSPADKYGLKEGDIIIGFNDEQINSYSDLSYQLRKTMIDDEVSILVVRNNRFLKLDLKLFAYKIEE